VAAAAFTVPLDSHVVVAASPSITVTLVVSPALVALLLVTVPSITVTVVVVDAGKPLFGLLNAAQPRIVS